MPENIAILVIHGIGQQRPYETLDQFTLGLAQTFGNPVMEPRLDICRDPLRDQKQWVRASCVMSPAVGRNTFLSDQGGGATIGSISLFEYYWAPVTQDKVTYLGSLWFLIKAGFTPFLYFGANLQVLTAVNKKWEIWKVIAKEIWRQVLLFLPLILLFALLLRFLTAFSDPRKLIGLYQLIPTASKVLAVILAIRYLYLGMIVNTLLGTRKAKYTWQASWWWRWFLVIGILGHVFLWPLLISPVLCGIAWFGMWLAHFGWLRFLPVVFGHWSRQLRELSSVTHSSFGCDGWRAFFNDVLFLKPSFSHYEYLSLVLFFLLAYFARWILVGYVGDLAVYLNASELAKNFAARSQILDEGTGALSELVRMRDPANPANYVYDRVLVAGHSLGSVIAYDSITELLKRCRAGLAANPKDVQPADLDKLRGMVTFGCPLNKVFYFFREKMDPKQSLRRQILDLLHGFRLEAAICSYPPGPNGGPMNRNNDPRWAQAEGSLDSGFRWINAWSPMDPVSGKLLFYDLQVGQNQKRVWFGPWNFGRAHILYWTDPDFYSFIRDRLL
jgi:hypothetical protein